MKASLRPYGIPVRQNLIAMAGAALIYFVAARLSLFLAVGNTHATSVWPPSGIALAVVLLWGYRMGPAVLLGAFAANVLTLKGAGLAPAQYVAIAFVTAFGNMLEGLTGAWFVKRFTGGDHPLDTLKDLFTFILLAAFVGTLISPSIGVGGFCLASGSWAAFGRLWLTWWLGDAAGILIVSPLIIMLKKKMLPDFSPVRQAESFFVFLVAVGLSVAIFGWGYQIEYVIIPPILWLAIRSGRLYSAFAVLCVCAVAVFFTVRGAADLSGDAAQRSLLYLQTYIGVISIVALCLSVLMHELSEAGKLRAAAEKQMNDIIEFLPDATLAIDQNGFVLAWNRAMEELTGVYKADMLGKDHYEYALPFFGERRPILIDLVLHNGSLTNPNTYEHFERLNNSLTAERYNEKLGRHLSGAASVLVDAEGRIAGAIESIRDITLRKTVEQDLQRHKEHLEEIVRERSAALTEANERLTRQIEALDRAQTALSESEKKYRDLVESANSVILRWRPDGGVTFFNAYAQRFFGFTEAEILGKSILGTIVPIVESSGRDLKVLIDDIVRHPEGHTFNENENIRKNGTKVWIAWTNKPIFDAAGTLQEILSVGNDITRRKAMEESLKKTLAELAVAKERAEAADRIKSAFLATMSHELRTPLNSIIGFTGIILQGLAGPLNAEQQKQMSMVKASAQHLLSLINDVLDISKIEAGQLQVHHEPFDLRAVIEKAVAVLKPAAEKKGLSLNVHVATEVQKAFGDQRRVEQVLLNLLTNAVKFTELGNVTLTADILPAGNRPNTGRADEPAPVVRVRVTDTGIGIRPEDLRELFQPFRQIDTGLARKNEGTGLGLAICRRLAELMDGEINAQSDWGRGSTFEFILPLGGDHRDETEHSHD